MLCYEDYMSTNVTGKADWVGSIHAHLCCVVSCELSIVYMYWQLTFSQLHRSEAAEACATARQLRRVGKFAGSGEEYRLGSAVYGLPACEHSTEQHHACGQ